MIERTEKGWATFVYRDETLATQRQEGSWRKSSYSGGGNDCVEVAFSTHAAGVRDSKHVASGALWLTTRGWYAFRRNQR